MATDDPVAEVVERLRSMAAVQRQNASFNTDDEVFGEFSRGNADFFEHAADLLERLSRERDTAHAVIEDIAGASWGTMASNTATPVAMTAKALTIDKAAKYLEANAPQGKPRERDTPHACQFCTMPDGQHDDECPYDTRERDTGVPEGFWLAPIEPTREMIEAGRHEYNFAVDAGAGTQKTQKAYAAMLSAAPQPPTVSPDIDALTRERDQAREALADILDYRGGAANALEDEYVMERARSVLHPEKPEVTHVT